MTEETANGSRIVWIDGARGLALWAMAGFHLTWDLAFFGWIDPGLPYADGFHWLGHAIAASFLLLVGFSLVLARQARGPLMRSRAFWRRWLGLVAAAAAISLVSFQLFPDRPIFFGILHCIALASLIVAPLVDAPLLFLFAAGAAALVAPLLVAAPLFDAPALWWVGIGTFEPSSNDYRPLLPWLAFVLFGVALARIARRPGERSVGRSIGPAARALAFCGRHSLAFYLIHQPVLFGALSAMALFVVSPNHEKLFVGQCAAQCFTDTQEADICDRTCACVIAKAKARGIWPAMARDALSAAQKAQAHDDVMACFGDSHAR
jgi:uncharacterized membrane protein